MASVTAESLFAAPAATRARSLFISLWGDVLVPHGNHFWLSGIIALAAALQLNPRLVRTTLFRLSEDGWLTSERIGRRSRYGLTQDGQRRVDLASERIYGAALPPWSGYWSLLLEGRGIDASRRRILERDLKWQGFASFATGLYARPERDANSLDELLDSTGMAQKVARFRAESPDGAAPQALMSVIQHAYGLEQVAIRYREFIAHFSTQFGEIDDLSEADTFDMRVRLIHEYRRVLLLDPELPRVLLPENWPGHRAHRLARTLYQRLLPKSESFVSATLREEADIEHATATLKRRFPVRR